MRIEFHPEAEAELWDAVNWYEDRSALAGDRFLRSIREAVSAVAADPLRFQLLDEGLRVFRLRKFPFKVIYSHDASGDSLLIVAIMHEKRRPDYWRGRL